jgi:hypothetical protein
VLPARQPPPPWPPCLFQFGTSLFHFRLEPCLISAHLAIAVGHGPQFIKHGSDVTRHADLICLRMVGFSARLMAAGLMVA